MNSFLRVVRQVLRYRLAIVTSMVCSLLVGALWGANIGALYPVMRVVFHGQSLGTSLKNQQAEGEAACVRLNEELADVDSKIRAAESAATPDAKLVGQLDAKRSSLRTRLLTEQTGIAAARRLERWISWMPDDPFTALAVIMGALLAGTVLKGFFLAGSEYLVSRLSQRVLLDLRKRCFRHALRLDMHSLADDRSGRLICRMTHDLDHVQGAVQCVFGQGVREPLKMVACLIGAAIISWQLLLVALLVVPLGVLAMRWLMKSVNRNSKETMTGMGELYQRLSESFRGIKLVLAFNRQRLERWKFHHVAKRIHERCLKLAAARSALRPFSEVVGMSAVCLSILAGAYLLLNRETRLLGIPLASSPLRAESLIMFFGMLVGVTEPLRKLSPILVQFQRGSAAAERLYELLDREPTIQNPPSPEVRPQHFDRLVIRDLTFGYDPQTEILKQLNLVIHRGEKVALVGPNGCGKSTLMNLIPRFYDPDRGSICVNEIDIRQLRLSDLRQIVSVVPQETHLFDETIANNLRYADHHASREQIEQAARHALAHDFILNKLDAGYDTMVGENGFRLSGGQRQRLALARALLRGSPVLILDEATSHLDIESEQRLYRTLGNHYPDQTVLIVTHRLAALDVVDRVLLLREGRIVADGSHAKLLATEPAYRQLIDQERSAA